MMVVEANAANIAEYRRLLTSEWTRSWVRDVLALLWASVSAPSPNADTTALLDLLDPAPSVGYPNDVFYGVLHRLKDGAAFMRMSGLPTLPVVYAPLRPLSGPAWQGVRFATWLTLPAHVPLSGDEAFLVDVRALAFQATLHFVLPALRDKSPQEHAILLHAAALFALGYAAVDPAQSAYALSLIHGYLGEDDQRLRSLLAAFRLTSPHDHVYLTRAQEYWTELLDAQRHEEAEKFLLGLHATCLPAHQDEVRAMIVAAFRFILRGNRASV